jgi:cobalt ECF transporter T component CbiQ
VGFVEKLVRDLYAAMEHALVAEATAERPGLLQQLDPRVKLIGVFALIGAAVSTRSLSVIGALFLFALALALLSRVSVRILVTRVWVGVLLFTGVIAVPAIVLVPGDVVGHIPVVGWPMSAQGLTSAAFLVGRAETAATLCLLLVLCTPWAHVLKALRVLRVPAVPVVLLGMTHRYVFLLLQTARDMFESRRSRLIGSLDGAERRRLATASAGVLLGKSMQVGLEVHLAMQARGYRGEVHVLDDFRMKLGDWAALGAFLAVAVAAVGLGS